MKLDSQAWSKAFRGIGGRLWWLAMIPASLELSRIKGKQKAAFHCLQEGFGSLYDSLRMYDFSKFTVPFWSDINSRLERAFLPRPPFSFLRVPEVRATMFSPYRNPVVIASLAFLERSVSEERLRTLLQEDYVGNPTLVSYKYLASSNTIFHLYHFVRFSDQVECRLDEIRTIVDWGGGYGSMARIFDRLVSNPYTYVIIDIPLLSCIQWLYLSTILGEERVHISQKPEDGIEFGKVNLVPLCFLEQSQVSGDLFISTWALSESSVFAQDYVVNQNWFGAKHLLLAFQNSNSEFCQAKRLGPIAENYGAKVEEMAFFPRNYYAIR